MLINEVCKKSRLTKKAIEYYEKKGLIQPNRDDNGYRVYSSSQLDVLKEISLLRRLDLSIDDIGRVINSDNKSKELQHIRAIRNLRIKKQEAINTFIDKLSDNYNIEKVFDNIFDNIDRLYSIREKLIYNFPGTYGIFLSNHFGRFLNTDIDNEAKRIAYLAIIKYLDDIEFSIPEELKQYLEQNYDNSSEMSNNMIDEIHASINDIDRYVDNNKEILEQYISYRTSDEYENSMANKFQQMLIDFQDTSGYKERFIDNIKVLSPEYEEYIRKLELFNNQMLEKYPVLDILNKKE